MTSKEIQESGLLELYALGILEDKEVRQVAQYLEQYPELKMVMKDIERALQGYAFANAIAPSPELRAKILAEIKKTGSPMPEAKSDTQAAPSSAKGFLRFLVFGLAALTALFAYLWYQGNQNYTDLQGRYQAQVDSCDSLQRANELSNIAYAAITNPNVQMVVVTETGKYPETQLYLYTNPVTQKNYLKLNRLPSIDDATQSFQLWSIKGDAPPVPLDVFQSDDQALLEVRHVEATDVYAITIEEKGGKESPNLADLIGTFAI